MSKTRALVKRQLDSNTDYEVTVTLDDDGQENKQVRRFNLKTPFFYSVLLMFQLYNSICTFWRK